MTEKQMVLQVIFSPDNKNMRIDMKRVGVTDQEAIGILEMAKQSILEENKQRQTIVTQSKDNGNL